MSILDQFKKKQASLSGAGRPMEPQGNIIFRPSEFDEKASTATGEVLSGPAAGQIITVNIPNNGGKSVGVKEFTKKGHKSFVDIEAGGTLRLEKVKKNAEGVYDTRWAKTFQGVPLNNQTVILDAIVSMTMVGKPDSDPAKDTRKFLVSKYEVDQVKDVKTMSDLENAIHTSLKESGGVSIFGVEDGKVFELTYELKDTPPAKPGGEYTPGDPGELTSSIMEGVKEYADSFSAMMDAKAFSVVPIRKLWVGTDTATAIKEKLDEIAEHGTSKLNAPVDVDHYKPLSLGVQVQIALATKGNDAIGRDVSERLKERFLETADKSATDKFHSKGWRGVSDLDIRTFFAAQGVELSEAPATTFTRQNLLVLGERSLIKSFGVEYSVPYPNVSACEDAIKAARTEVRDAIIAVAEAPSVKAEKPAAAQQKAAATPAASEVDDNDIADLDDILADIENDQGDPTV